jgi:hypothetical protein
MDLSSIVLVNDKGVRVGIVSISPDGAGVDGRLEVTLDCRRTGKLLGWPQKTEKLPTVGSLISK